MRKPPSRQRALLSLLLVCVAPACGNVPRVGPFVESTRALNVVVAALGADLRVQFAADQRDRFDEAWGARVTAMQAMADYAAGLAQVVEAGRSGEQAATEVLDGARRLLDTVGEAFPGTGSTGGVVSQTLAQIYGRLAEARAARTVAAAIEYADPSVREVASALAQDFATLKQLVQDAHRRDVLAIKAKSKEGDARGLLLRSLLDEAAERRELAAKEADPTKRDGFAREAAQFDELARQEMASDWYRDMRAALDAAALGAAARVEALDTAATATLAWSGSHADLARVARSGLSVDFGVLAQLTKELIEAHSKVRNS